MNNSQDREKNPRPAKVRALELFCGIGGLAAALPGPEIEIVEAIDINHHALAVVRHNFPHPATVRNLQTLKPAALPDPEADLWWMSPPCQPFTRRGKGQDDRDPRSKPLLNLLDVIETALPRYLALENVPQFRTSRCRDLLVAVLTDHGYQIREQLLCPTALGIPNRRLRYYLIASREGRLLAEKDRPLPARRLPLQAFLDPCASEDLALDAETLDRYRPALHLVQPGDPTAVTHCFTSAYGRSPVRSGSYLATRDGVRRFSPQEILRLLGFSPHFSFPEDMPLSSQWRLAGNSLSVPAVRHVLAAVPELLDRISRKVIHPSGSDGPEGPAVVDVEPRSPQEMPRL